MDVWRSPSEGDRRGVQGFDVVSGIPGPIAFNASVHSRPADASAGADLEDALGAWPTLVVSAVSASAPFAISADECLERLGSMARTAVEPDGSFVWSRDSDANGPAWHVWGTLHERDHAVLFVELRGTCLPDDLDALLAVVGWPHAPLMFQLPAAGVFLDEATFRRRATIEAQSSA